ncbi:MAG: hypothetical protein K5868_02225 [Lachnospiraceae bacterium]|nr:hypothetical protein [Lachnospiraceae bacterium]
MGEQYNSWPLWYLLSTVYSLIIIYFYMKKWKRPEYLVVLSVVASIICTGMASFINHEETYSTVFEIIRKIINWTISKGQVFIGLIYIPLGMLLSRKQMPRAINYLVLIGGGIINFIIKNEAISGYLTIISPIGLFGLIESASVNNNICARLRAHSTVIYLIHMYIWSLYYKIVYGQKTFGLDSFLITSVIALTIAVLYYYGTEFLRYRTNKKRV